MKRSILMVSFALLALSACSDESSNNSNNPNIFNPNNVNATNNTNSTNNAMDVGPDAAEPDMASTNNANNEMDMGFDLSVENPGYLHGVWQATVIDGDPELQGPIAVFTMRHEEGATTATGIWTSERFAESGELGTTNWQNDILTTSFTFRKDNETSTFGLSMGSPTDANTIDGTWNYSATGTFGSIQLVRQQ